MPSPEANRAGPGGTPQASRGGAGPSLDATGFPFCDNDFTGPDGSIAGPGRPLS
jgi:hypothetical protein